MIEVEFYGVPRLRAGTDRCAVPAGTLTEVLGALAVKLPGLVPDVVELEGHNGHNKSNPPRAGRVGRHVLVSLDGRVVLDDPGAEITDGQTLVLLSAQAGG